MRIRWNSHGKIDQVWKQSLDVLTPINQRIYYSYNAAGNRVRKEVINYIYPANSKVTYYVRDANEQVLAIYEQSASPGEGGGEDCIKTQYQVVTEPNQTINDSDNDWVPDECDICRDATDPWQEDFDGDGVGDACDNCPQIYNPRNGSQPQQPCQGQATPVPSAVVWWRSPSGGPVQQHGWSTNSVTRSRAGWALGEAMIAEFVVYGKTAQSRFAVVKPNEARNTNPVMSSHYTRQLDKKQYELKDHLKSVRVVVGDTKLNSGVPSSPLFSADIKSYSNFYPYGMIEPGRSYQVPEHRFGFSGKELDNEVSGIGNTIDFGARIYDARLGRWSSTDPIAHEYSWLSSYSYAASMPVNHIDPDGERVRLVFHEDTDLNDIKIIEKIANDFMEYVGDYSPEIKWLLETDEVEISIMVNTQMQTEFRVPHHPDVVWWDPFVAVSTESATTSGLQGLLHELTHVVAYHRPTLFMSRKTVTELRKIGPDLLEPANGTLKRKGNLLTEAQMLALGVPIEQIRNMHLNFPHQEELYATMLENNLVENINDKAIKENDNRALTYPLYNRGWTYIAKGSIVAAAPASVLRHKEGSKMMILPSWEAIPGDEKEDTNAREPQGANRPNRAPQRERGHRQY